MRGLTIQKGVFYEWKQKKNTGWAPSGDPTTKILAPWLSATPCSMYETKKTSKSLSLRELEPFQNLPIPIPNLQFHCKYVSLWEGLSEHGGLSPLRVQSAGGSDQPFAAKLSAWWAAKRRLILNSRHGVISIWILANQTFSLSYGENQQDWPLSLRAAKMV